VTVPPRSGRVYRRTGWYRLLAWRNSLRVGRRLLALPPLELVLLGDRAGFHVFDQVAVFLHGLVQDLVELPLFLFFRVSECLFQACPPRSERGGPRRWRTAGNAPATGAVSSAPAHKVLQPVCRERFPAARTKLWPGSRVPAFRVVPPP